MELRYEVFDLGAHEVLARFRSKDDAVAWATAKSVDGPALQVRTLLNPAFTFTNADLDQAGGAHVSNTLKRRD